jgi:hypothetical protein
VGLGGLGLENTERFGVAPGPHQRKISPWNAKLAFHLLYRPWLSPMAMPSLGFPSYVEKRVAKRMRSVVPSYCRAEVTPPCGSMTPAELLGVLSREEWMKTFQMELEIETPDVHVNGPVLGFHPNLGKRCALERTSLLVKALKGYQQSRQKLYGDLTWLNSPEISEAALAGYLPSTMFYNCSSEKSPVVQLGFERHTLPLVGVMKRTAGYAKFLTPPIVTEAGFDPGTWTIPVFGAPAIAMLQDRPAPFGLRRCS